MDAAAARAFCGEGARHGLVPTKTPQLPGTSDRCLVFRQDPQLPIFSAASRPSRFYFEECTQQSRGRCGWMVRRGLRACAFLTVNSS
jgi:hypothetical protein